MLRQCPRTPKPAPASGICPRSRTLIQMATGAGKTYTACNFIYRLIKHAGTCSILFLVDRNNLGCHTLAEFQRFRTPGDGRLFTELYNVQHMRSNKLDAVSKVCITTIQCLFSMLRGEAGYDSGNEENSTFLLGETADRPVEVVYNPALPIETFDSIVTDECHRINTDDLNSATPDTAAKTHYVIIDAVGVCEQPFADSKPLDKKPGVTFKRLLESVARGSRQPDTLSSIAPRLARLDRRLTIEPDDFDLSPFAQHGGLGRAVELFGPELPGLLDELNKESRQNIIGDPDDFEHRIRYKN